MEFVNLNLNHPLKKICQHMSTIWPAFFLLNLSVCTLFAKSPGPKVAYYIIYIYYLLYIYLFMYYIIYIYVHLKMPPNKLAKGVVQKQAGT
jgi:uncharacterized membrane protein